MSETLTRGDYWGKLKEVGFQPDRHFRDYSTADLKNLWAQHAPQSLPEPQRPAHWDAPTEEKLSLIPAPEFPEPSSESSASPSYSSESGEVVTLHDELPVSNTPDEHAGMRSTTHSPDEPIRRDENGILWYQDEIQKSAIPKPRMRRVQRYIDPGVKTVTARAANGSLVESFEMPGDQRRPAEARVTLPSYQAGIYKDPNLAPFRIHTYQNQRGFNYFDVVEFYGGRDLVPSWLRRIYVANDLCFEIDSVVQAIQQEAREIQLNQNRQIGI